MGKIYLDAAIGCLIVWKFREDVKTLTYFDTQSKVLPNRSLDVSEGGPNQNFLKLYAFSFECRYSESPIFSKNAIAFD